LILSGDFSVEQSFFFEASRNSVRGISVEAYCSRNAFLFSSSVAEPIQPERSNAIFLYSLHALRLVRVENDRLYPPSMIHHSPPGTVRTPGEGLDTPGGPA